MAEARVFLNQRIADRYTKPKNRSTGSKYRYSKSSDSRCDRCGYAEHLRGGSCPALGQRCNKCNAKGHFANVCRSKPKHNMVNCESLKVKAYEIEREDAKPYRGEAERDGTVPFVGDIERDQSTAFLSVVDCIEKKKRMVCNFESETDATSFKN